MTRRGTNDYPVDWPELALMIKTQANWRCVRCEHPHDPMNGYTLTVHHLDRDKSNCAWWNLLALCQRCHLSIQGRVNLYQAWMFEHSEWFKVYAAGWYAWKYYGQWITRHDAEKRLDELLGLERVL